MHVPISHHPIQVIHGTFEGDLKWTLFRPGDPPGVMENMLQNNDMTCYIYIHTDILTTLKKAIIGNYFEDFGFIFGCRM